MGNFSGCRAWKEKGANYSFCMNEAESLFTLYHRWDTRICQNQVGIFANMHRPLTSDSPKPCKLAAIQSLLSSAVSLMWTGERAKADSNKAMHGLATISKCITVQKGEMKDGDIPQKGTLDCSASLWILMWYWLLNLRWSCGLDSWIMNMP